MKLLFYTSFAFHIHSQILMLRFFLIKKSSYLPIKLEKYLAILLILKNAVLLLASK